MTALRSITVALLFGVGLPAWASPLAVGPAFDLSRSPKLQVHDLPDSSRSEDPDVAEVTGGWRLVATAAGVRTWEAPLPVRPRTLFFSRPPNDMAVLQRSDADEPWDDAPKVKHKRGIIGNSDKADTWEFTTRSLRIRRPAAEGPPEAHEYAIRYTKAIERELSLQRKHFEGEAIDFVQRSLQVDDTTRSGLLLPAPSRVSMTIDVQRGAVLDLGAMIVPPEAADPSYSSDGARLVVKVLGQDRQETVLSRPLTLGHHVRSRVKLEAWEGQQVQLELSTDPGDSPDLDYVFVTEPVVHVPDDDPPRVALVFIDTLRPDHMSLYGYDRSTTPRLDEWARGAATFESARSVAPWTLPSARTMVTGAQPERWELVDTIQETLGSQGWATGFFAGNVYLSSNFEMSRGWGTHQCTNWPLAQVQVDRSLEFIEQHRDQPTFVLLHLMDMHLPYTEPPQYRRLFAGSTPEQLGGDDFLRGDVVKARRSLGEEGRQYVRDRYDNNLRYVDDQVARFLEAFDEDDLVLIVSDHGEEFWDHNGFEHGHTLYEELLKVPMVVRGPGLQPGRVATPTSLLDLAPTIAMATGNSLDEYDGKPLQDLTDESRPLAFGRPLYGEARWGVLHEGTKYRSSKGSEHLNDLAKDPEERKDLISKMDPEPWREAMAEGLGRPVDLGFRLLPSRPNQEITACLTVPGGVAWAYPADDPTARNSAEVEVSGEQVRITWPKENRASLEVFVAPAQPAREVVADLRLQLGDSEDGLARASFEVDKIPEPTEGNSTLWRAKGAGSVQLTWAVAPGPLEQGKAVGGFDSEVSAELMALGYVEEEEPDEDPDEAQPSPDAPMPTAAPLCDFGNQDE